MESLRKGRHRLLFLGRREFLQGCSFHRQDSTVADAVLALQKHEAICSHICTLKQQKRTAMMSSRCSKVGSKLT